MIHSRWIEPSLTQNPCLIETTAVILPPVTRQSASNSGSCSNIKAKPNTFFLFGFFCSSYFSQLDFTAVYCVHAPATEMCEPLFEVTEEEEKEEENEEAGC